MKSLGKHSKGLTVRTENTLLPSNSKANVRFRGKVEYKYLLQHEDKVEENRKVREVKSVDQFPVLWGVSFALPVMMSLSR